MINISKWLFHGYKAIYVFLTVLVLNDFGAINVVGKYQGFLTDAGEEAYEFIVANRLSPEKSNKNISVIITRDKDLDNFPNYEEKELVSTFLKVLETRSDQLYTDEYGEQEQITYNDVRDEYCNSIHPDASASRYAITTALEKILEQKPKVVILDYLFKGRSSHCSEYDEKLESIISNNKNVFIMAGNVAIGSEENNIQDVNPQVYIHTSSLQKSENSKIHDSLIYPFFKDIYKENQSLNNMGSGNIIIDSSVITKGRLWVNTENYKIPTTPLLASQFLNNKQEYDAVVRINWREGDGVNLYHTRDIKSIILEDFQEYKDKIVLFGSNLTGKSQDRVYTPIDDKPIPGVYVQANIIDNAVNNDFITMNPDWLPVVLTMLVITLLFFAYDSQTILPHSCEYIGWYRRLSTSLHNIFNFDIGEADFFLFIEGGAILISLLVLYFFNYYIDISGPVLGGIIAFSFFSIYGFIANKYLFQKGLLMNEYINSTKYKQIHLLKVDFNSRQRKEECEDDIEKKILTIMSDNYGVIVGETALYNDDDIFGSISIANHYWWVTLEEFDTLKPSISSTLEKDLNKYKKQIEIHHSIQDLTSNLENKSLLDSLLSNSKRIF